MTLELISGTLWQKIVHQTELAIESGALHSIQTLSQEIDQDGCDFTVRIAKNLKRKREQKKTHPEFNPFLPPEPSLTVSDISPTHIAVLNKFNVVNHHLLIVTRKFESQERLLSESDFYALCRCLTEYPALGFYNGGEAAGASQKHKHLQLVPLPLYGGTRPYPFSSILRVNDHCTAIQQLSQLPFNHAWCNLPKNLFNDPDQAATYCNKLYREMLMHVSIEAIADAEGALQSAPYNLLVTTQWMLLVPRSRECWQEISINALGYVGSLFVSDQSALEKLDNFGPLNLLKEVSIIYRHAHAVTDSE
ncbi:MAG: Ap4A phosphorylase II [Candidatus Thiodiazotropha sp. 6PLUC9]